MTENEIRTIANALDERGQRLRYEMNLAHGTFAHAAIEDAWLDNCHAVATIAEMHLGPVSA